MNSARLAGPFELHLRAPGLREWHAAESRNAVLSAAELRGTDPELRWVWCDRNRPLSSVREFLERARRASRQSTAETQTPKRGFRTTGSSMIRRKFQRMSQKAPRHTTSGKQRVLIRLGRVAERAGPPQASRSFRREMSQSRASARTASKKFRTPRLVIPAAPEGDPLRQRESSCRKVAFPRDLDVTQSELGEICQDPTSPNNFIQSCSSVGRI